MGEIIARWEWRTFGASFGNAEEKIRRFPQDKTRTSEEIYILSARSENNTKIRDALMDVKTLKTVNPDKLEQWVPVMKQAFPIPAASLRELASHWGIPYPELKKQEYSYEEFLGNLVARNPDLKTVQVRKSRQGFTVNECIVEIADLEFDRQPIRTIAVEMADPQAVLRTVKELGLSDFENINYIRALKRHVGA